MDISSFILGLKMGGSGGGGGDITVEQLNVSSNNTYTAPSGKAYSPVVVNVPNTYAAGDEGKVVSNGALVAQSSDTVTQNGTVDTTLINSLLVNVSGGGGASNVATGTFTPNSTGVSSFDTGYNGNGFPVVLVIAVDGGVYNNAVADWFNVNHYNNIGMYTMVKSKMNIAPSYNSTFDDNGTCATVYKNNNSTFTSYGSAGHAYIKTYKQTDPDTSNGVLTCVAISDKKTIKYVAGEAGNEGFAKDITYRYWVIYSE